MKNLIRAEWTKFRTVRGWVVGVLVAIPLTVLIGVLGPATSNVSCSAPDAGVCAGRTPPTTADGTPVIDAFTFVHRTLTGDGSITARVAPLPDDAEPWAKAGVIIKQGTEPGSSYAAVLLTGDHGVRMQYDFTEDVAGPKDTRWVRLSREGDTLTGAVSPDGERWTTISAVQLDLGERVEAGMFVASPEFVEVTRGFGATGSSGGPTSVTTTFDDVGTDGDWAGSWRDTAVGSPSGDGTGFTEDGGEFTLTGSGDIRPIVQSLGSLGKTVEDKLIGVFAGLIAVLVVATMFVTSEYRRGLVRTSFAANPHRGQVLAAKAVVMGSVSFVVGVVAAAITIPVVESVEVSKGFFFQFPSSTFTELRVIAGTGLLFGVSSVLAVAVGALLRRGGGTVTAVVVGIVLPYLLAVAPVLPPGPADLLTMVTPAAAFAMQQTVLEYPQVSFDYVTAEGYFPLSPAGGAAVLFVYAAVAVAFATVALRRRDA